MEDKLSGQSVVVTCNNCHKSVTLKSSRQRFCPNCGGQLEITELQPQPNSGRSSYEYNAVQYEKDNEVEDNNERIIVEPISVNTYNTHTINSYNDMVQTDICSIRDKLMDIALGKNQQYYIRKFSKKSPIGWNAGAFFLGAIWYVYRKMYLWAVAYWFAVAFTGIFGQLGFTMFANAIYKKHIDKLVNKAEGMPDSDAYAYVGAKGGTNGAAAAVIAFICIMIFICVMAAET